MDLAQAHQALQQMAGQAGERKRALEPKAGARAAAQQPPAQRMRPTAGAPRCQPGPLPTFAAIAWLAGLRQHRRARCMYELASGRHAGDKML